MGLVYTWLKGVGLAYAWPTFEAAGIVTPTALAHLDPKVFPALGISGPDDRLKLFYLVTRIKMALDKDSNSNDGDANESDVASTVDQLLADTLQQEKQQQQQQQSLELSQPPSNPHSQSRSTSTLPDVTSTEEEEDEPVLEDEEEDFEDDDQAEAETPVQEARRVLASKVVLAPQQSATSFPRKPASTASTRASGSIHSAKTSASTTATGESFAPQSPRDSLALDSRKVQAAAAVVSPRNNSTSRPTSRMVPPSSSASSSTATLSKAPRTSLQQPAKTRMAATKPTSRLAGMSRQGSDRLSQPKRRPPPPKEGRGNEQNMINTKGSNDSMEEDEKANHGTVTTTTTSPHNQRRSMEEDQQEEADDNSTNQAQDSQWKPSVASPQAKEKPISTVREGSIASRTRSARSRQQQRPTEATSEQHGSGLTPPRQRIQRPTSSSSNTGTNTTAVLSRTTTTKTSGLRANQPKSNRTGKSLSIIHSDRILPMSPLMDFVSSTKSDNQSVSGEDEVHSNEDVTPKNARSRSSGRVERRMSNSSQNSTGSRRRSNQQQQHHSKQPRRTSLDNSSDSEHSAASRTSVGSIGSQQRRRTRFDTGPRTTTKNNHNNNRGVTDPPKRKEDTRRKTVGVVSRGQQQQRRETYDHPTSFKDQIDDLRDDNDEEHEELLKAVSSSSSDGSDEDDDMRIRVVVRKRPMSQTEQSATGSVDVIHPLNYGQYGRVLVYQPKTRVDLTKEIDTVPFSYDNVFDEGSTNTQIYERTVRNLIPPLFEGQWGCVFAYGQTGSGKTFTMMGSNMTTNQNNRDANRMNNLGLYYMAALDIFQALATPGFEHFSVCVSLFEIYGGKLFDLLNKRTQIKCLEDQHGKVRFPGLSEHDLDSADALIAMIEEGSCNRSTGSTSRNSDSSRSHAVLQLHIYQPPPTRRRASSRRTEFSRLTFIDLAGSERGADTYTSSKETRMEGAEINTSLLALKEVIRALATGDSMAHVPFRGSKLTQVLKESFVGESCRSVMIACVSPNIADCEQTLNTLRYANRVKERNPDTGELSALVQTSSVSSTKKTKPRSSSRAHGGRSNSALSATKSTEEDVEDAPRQDGNEEEDEFDELFRSAAEPRSTNESKREQTQKDRARSPKKTSGALSRASSDHSFNSNTLDEILGETDPAAEVIQQVVLTHKEGVDTWVDETNKEIELVHAVESNQLGIEDYIVAVDKIITRRRNVYSSLRESIQEYRTLRNQSRSTNSIPQVSRNGNVGHLSEDEGSIEDLRD